MIKINFKELNIEDKVILDEFFKLNYHENAHLNFTNLFMWRKPYQIMWCLENDIVYFKATYDNQEFALQPLCVKEKIFEAINRLSIYFKEKNTDFILSGLEENFVKELENYPGGEFEFMTNRDDDDYVYNSVDLINLSGRKFH